MDTYLNEYKIEENQPDLKGIDFLSDQAENPNLLDGWRNGCLSIFLLFPSPNLMGGYLVKLVGLWAPNFRSVITARNGSDVHLTCAQIRRGVADGGKIDVFRVYSAGLRRMEHIVGV